MARRYALIACLVAGLLSAGCATYDESWEKDDPVTVDVIDARVRVLRRLVLLPPTYEIDGNIDREWTQESEDRWLERELTAYLADWKGYEPVPILAPMPPGVPAAETLRERLLERLDAERQQTQLDAQLTKDVQAFAAAHGADGVLVASLRYVGLNAKRWGALYGITFFTMGVGQYAYLDKLGTYLQAAVFEGGDGRLVWYGRNKSGGWDAPEDADKVGKYLFDGLPNAEPATATRERRGAGG